MNITFVRAFTDNYIWLLYSNPGKAILCVDPGEAQPVLDYLKINNVTLEAILLTHHHHDHTGGVPELLMHFPEAKVYGPDDSRVQDLAQTIIRKTEFELQGFQFHHLKTPGHTSSHICFYESNYGLLFCGDTLFSAGCGRIFDGSPELLLESLFQIKALPDETRVFCGHEYTRQNLRFAAMVEPDNRVIEQYSRQLAATPNSSTLPSTIALEKQINPFLRLNQPEIIQYARTRGCNNPDSLAVFKQLRRDKDVFS